VVNVRYNANGGSGTMANQTITYDVPTNLSANAFTRTGYTFRGWNISSTASTATYTDRQSVSNLHTADNYTVDLYAIWKANSYTVAFNANGGTGTMANLTMTYGTAKALTANAFTRTDYTFAGWNTKANGSGTSYTNKQSVSNLTSVSGGAVTLYAVWTPKSFTITYKNIGGGAYTGNNSSSLPATHTYGTATVIPAGKSDSGTFLGWYTSSDGMSEPVSTLGETAYTANITLYAQWTGTVTLNHDGGTSSQSSLDINTGEKKVVTPPTKTNYVFQGYYTERLGKGTKYFDANGKFTKAWDLGGKTTLYAGWKYKAMNNFNAVWSEDDIACSWTNPEKTYTISVLYSNVSIYSSTTGGATSCTIRDNVLDWNKANGKSDGYLTVKSYYLDSNSIDGKGIEVSIKLPKCLRFVGTSSFSITANNGKTWDGVLQYSTNGSSWNEWNGEVIESGSSKYIYVRGENNTVITGNSNTYRWNISTTGTISCYGNIEYLLNYKTADMDYNPNMVNYCYSFLFYNCTSLMKAPSLPATTLAYSC
ncbi:MAG: InlB B-repeat-containing protein, partial [Spirochaetales bacterium]|nr:InlB B-repeat-containing protein [Spirochaetales bacterium]